MSVQVRLLLKAIPEASIFFVQLRPILEFPEALYVSNMLGDCHATGMSSVFNCLFSVGAGWFCVGRVLQALVNRHASMRADWIVTRIIE